MKFNTFFQITVMLFISFITLELESTVKIFVNDSYRTLMIKVYDNNHNIISINLVPGAIQELFIPGKEIDKIVLQNKNYAQKSFGSITHQILYKESSKINENMTFIIHQNGSVKMYQSGTQKDKTLQEIDAIYTEKGKLPTLDIAIHTMKADKLSTMQDVTYTIKYTKSFFETIGSIFS